jgi:hypothetical protein
MQYIFLLQCESLKWYIKIDLHQKYGTKTKKNIQNIGNKDCKSFFFIYLTKYMTYSYNEPH